MMVDPLFRLPCILVAMVGLNTTATPPHPPPRAEEIAPSTTLEVLIKQRIGPLIVKVRLIPTILNRGKEREWFPSEN